MLLRLAQPPLVGLSWSLSAAAARYFAVPAEAAPSRRQRAGSVLALCASQAHGSAPQEAAVTYQKILDDADLAGQRIDDGNTDAVHAA